MGYFVFVVVLASGVYVFAFMLVVLFVLLNKLLVVLILHCCSLLVLAMWGRRAIIH